MNDETEKLKQAVKDLEQALVMERIHREAHVDQPFEMIVTLNPHFQMNLEFILGIHLYESASYRRTIFDVPWWSDPGQEELFKVWSSTTHAKD